MGHEGNVMKIYIAKFMDQSFIFYVVNYTSDIQNKY